jgi:cell division protein FtsB
MKIDLKALVAERDALAAEIKALRKQEPVAWVTEGCLSFQDNHYLGYR